MNDDYSASLTSKTIDELTSELQKIHDQIDMILTMNNSLDDKDITEGGGDPAMQAEYQKFLTHQKQVTAEINKRHMLDMLK